MNDELRRLAEQYPVPQADKLQRRLGSLERMADFYASKINEAPERQSTMFKGFISALTYAITTIKMYRKLTKQVNELAEEADNARSNS